MPRVANPPRVQNISATTPRKQSQPQQSPLKVPLNDDRQEKAARLQSRHALHDLQINSIIAAASPVRKLNNYNRAASDSPKTPQSQAARGKENIEDGGLAVVTMTPMKRVPILANFEEWMKMATDNKINAANSWNFALIDYFHDMSLLKEGDSVNFQKASCTLDGCVKIYTSRVDSVATETGKLLSGLADSGTKKGKRNGEEEEHEEGEDGAEDEEGEEGARKKTKRKAQRSSEATLASSFVSLQVKKMELEFTVDPLFKKVAADFDEGGAQGLLLNHLAIDASGRIVFDSSDDIDDATAEGDDIEKGQQERDDKFIPDAAEDTSVAALGARFFPDLARLDAQDICPSLKNFDLSNPSVSLDIPFLKASEDWMHDKVLPQPNGLGDQTGVFLDGDNVIGFDDDDGVLGGFNFGEDAGFGEGGDAWAKTVAVGLQTQHGGLEESGPTEGQRDGFGVDVVGVDQFDPGDNQYAVSMHHKNSDGGHEDILSYFDNALQKNWAGPEHWRIRRIKDLSKASIPAPSRRKEKEPLKIDFNAPLDHILAESIYTPAASNSAISLPKTQWKSKTRNLLPDDKHFNSRQLLQLFLKPKARIGQRRLGLRGHSQRNIKLSEILEGEVDEAFWARKENAANHSIVDDKAAQGDYDANFFQDDGLRLPNGLPEDEEDFVDTREAFSPGRSTPNADGPQVDGVLATDDDNQEGAFGNQLITQSRRLRPEYVQYARVAKKVDVRRLKEEMWRGIGFHDDPEKVGAGEQTLKAEGTPLKFTSIVNNLQTVYPQQAMADISTSYCFICLLHLANEKGLTIDNQPGLEELSISRDLTAEIVEHDG